MRNLWATRVLLLAALCGALGSQAAAQSASPTYLFLLEGKGVPTGTIHGFSVNTSTGALSELQDSPFSAGLGPQQMAVDPTNRFLYVTNQNSKDITGFSIDPSTGSLALLPGSPFFIGAEPVTMGIDPTGRFLYVFAGTTINSVSQESLFEYTIDSSSGALTLTSSSPTTWEGAAGLLITSIAFNLLGNMAYLGQAASNGQHGPVLICTVDFTSGALTQIASAQPASIQSDHLGMVPAGNLLFSTSAPDQKVDAFAIGAGGRLSEIAGSPYAIAAFPAAVLMHPSGNFLYVVNENEPYQAGANLSPYEGSIWGFSIGASTGALTAIPGSPFAGGINASSIGIDPTGSFAYVPSTNYVLGTFKGGAQIQGYAIGPSSGALSQFSTPAWTDSAQSTATQLVISGAASSTTDPTPAISSLLPSSTAAAGPGFTLQISGTGFMSSSRAYFAGQPRATSFVSPTQLTVSILPSDISNEGTVVVFVFNPLPGGGASTSVEFTMTSPLPVITLLSPSSVSAQPNGFSLFITGSNFLTSSVVDINSTPVTTVYLGPTVIRGDLPSGAVVAPGAATITVTNPPNAGLGGGTSNPLTLTIVPPAQKFSVTSISPSSAEAGGAAFTLTVNGAGFVAPSTGPPSSPGSQVTFGLANVPTTFVSSTQLTAAISASAIAISGNPYVIVTNPDGSSSTPITFTVTGPAVGSVNPPGLPAGSSALTLNVTGTAFEPNSIVLVSGSPRATTYVSSTLLQVTLLPQDIAQGGTLNITVLNPPPGGGVSPAVHFAVEEDSLVLADPNPAPITAGLPASIPLTFSSSSGTVSNPVHFAVKAVTPHAVGMATSFKPSATMAAGASPLSVTLLVTTQAKVNTSSIGPCQGLLHRWPGVSLLALALVSAGIFLLAARSRFARVAPQFLLLLLLCGLASLAACAGAGSGSSSSSQSSPPTGTQPGTYTITVTATSAGVAHDIPVVLKVM